jgi:hypothetical protein
MSATLIGRLAVSTTMHGFVAFADVSQGLYLPTGTVAQVIP